MVGHLVGLPLDETIAPIATLRGHRGRPPVSKIRPLLPANRATCAARDAECSEKSPFCSRISRLIALKSGIKK